MPPSAMIGTLCARGGARALGDRGDHRHADAGDDARGADRAGADPDLDGVDAEIAERSVASAVATLPATRSTFGVQLTDAAHHVEHALGVAVRRIDDEHVDAGVRRALRRARSASLPTPIAAPTRSRPRPSLQAFGYLIIFWMSLTVISPLSM